MHLKGTPLQLSKLVDSPETSIVGRSMTLEVVRVTERAAIAAASWRGRGDEKAADLTAVEAMRDELGRIPINGRIVIGEGERDEAPMLFIGEHVGRGDGMEVDIAVDPLEGTALCAKNHQGSMCVLAIAERGGLLRAPDVYMEKIAIGPGYPDGLVDLDQTPSENVKALARAKGVPLSEVSVCVLDRPRHSAIIEELRILGVSIKLIGDGDIAGVMNTSSPEASGVDLYIGIGGAPEGVLAAAAMRCLGGQLQGRLVLDTIGKRERAQHLGIGNCGRKYCLSDLAGGDVLFAATGVTDGSLVSGVKIYNRDVMTSTIVMRSWSGTTRWVTARHLRGG